MTVRVSKWSGVAVAMQSALAAADTITAITKANPGVASAAAHGMNNGDYVILRVTGMWQLDGVVARIANVAAGTFELEGIDTTLFDTFAAGTAEAITFGTTISTAMTVSASGGDFAMLTTTTIHGNQETQIPGMAGAMEYSLDHIWDVADAGLLALRAASRAQTARAFRFSFSNGQKIAFSAYPATNLNPGGSAGEVVKTPVKLAVEALPSVYST